MIIDVWSDVVCPWCYIGKRRLEKALESLPEGEQVEVRHRAFQLQPELAEVRPTAELLATKYRVDSDQVAKMQANVCQVADGEGLCYDLANTLSGNTLDAHRLLLWATTKGMQGELLEAMFSSYFERSEAVFSHADLMVITDRAGFERSEVATFLDSTEFAEQVADDQQLAQNLGASGVPFFVIDMKIGISGAQPQEVFEQALLQALETS